MCLSHDRPIRPRGREPPSSGSVFARRRDRFDRGERYIRPLVPGLCRDLCCFQLPVSDHPMHRLRGAANEIARPSDGDPRHLPACSTCRHAASPVDWLCCRVGNRLSIQYDGLRRMSTPKTTQKRQDPTFGARLKAMREAADLSQEEVAERVGVGRSRVSEWESGESVGRRNRLKLGGLFPGLLPDRGENTTGADKKPAPVGDLAELRGRALEVRELLAFALARQDSLAAAMGHSDVSRPLPPHNADGVRAAR